MIENLCGGISIRTGEYQCWTTACSPQEFNAQRSAVKAEEEPKICFHHHKRRCQKYSNWFPTLQEEESQEFETFTISSLSVLQSQTSLRRAVVV
jgi:hypothetical protein